MGAAVGNGVCTSTLPLLMPMPCVASAMIRVGEDEGLAEGAAPVDATVELAI